MGFVGRDDRGGGALSAGPRRDWPPQPVVSTGLAGRCPRCGEGKLFKGFLALGTKCEVCGLDFAFADSGDGPAVFVTLVGGAVVLGLALWTEFTFSPPIWVHVVVFVPLTLAVTLGLLRPLKGVMIAQQWRMKAEQGRFGG